MTQKFWTQTLRRMKLSFTEVENVISSADVRGRSGVHTHKPVYWCFAIDLQDTSHSTLVALEHIGAIIVVLSKMTPCSH